MLKRLLFVILITFSMNGFCARTLISPGADSLHDYLPLLKGQRVAVFANQTSLVKGQHLVDVLLKNKINIVKIFSPEHGFRGDQDAPVKNQRDAKTGLPIISLYGKKLKPSVDDLKEVDILVFDIQDVGVRFYTYIASLEKLMEAAIENNKPLIILDRPNPNGFYVDGPVLEKKYRSFTGMQPIPIVYGMTMGEYARLLVGEHWLHVTPAERSDQLKLTIIPCQGYTHHGYYVPPVKPSPSLPTIQSIYWYPIIGMLEGTSMSVGRGTPTPFQLFGHPRLRAPVTFIPREVPWLKNPPYKNQVCHGWRLPDSPQKIRERIHGRLPLQYLIQSYQHFPDKKHFFSGFSAVAGNALLEKQIKGGMREAAIRQSWEPALSHFKEIRKKYLLYSE